MTSLQYADKLLDEFRLGKKSVSVAKGENLECLITCTDNSVVKVTGLWAHDIMKLKEAEKSKTA